MTRLTGFGKNIQKKLIDLNQTQSWLIAEVHKKTGLYFDGSYLWKIKTGKIATPKIVQAIRDILSLPE